MAKIEVSKDQKTVTVDGIEYEFQPYERLKWGVCGFSNSRCAFIGKYFCFQIPCISVLRSNKKYGYFTLKQK